MKFVIFLLFLLFSFTSYSLTKDRCKKLYEVNSLFCSSNYWDEVAKINRKGVLHHYQLHPSNRVTGYIENNTRQERYDYLRWVLHGADLEPLMSDSHTVSILKPGEKSNIDFIFHEHSKKPLNQEGNFIRLRNFEVK